jgi:vancomycin resistance protein VanW
MISFKKWVPVPLKLIYRVSLRRYKDRINGNSKLFANKFCEPVLLHAILTITQPIKTTAASANKIHNLSLAIARINNILIQPGEIFSFWHLAGKPSQKNGYQKSRSIINGEMEAAPGGGLCQLSGLIYYLALRSGLQVIERHAHSIDIYTEEERFTPLGSDATVAYGYKDLRFLNQTAFPVCISFELTDSLLKGIVHATKITEPLTIEFELRKFPGYTDVDTICKNEGGSRIMHTDRYHQLHGMTRSTPIMEIPN